MVAHYTTGEPKVRCKRCGKSLEHPNRKKESRTSIGIKPLTRHVSGPGCSRASNKSVNQPLIGKMIEKMVSTLRYTYSS
jgi:hypothetical protein